MNKEQTIKYIKEILDRCEDEELLELILMILWKSAPGFSDIV